MVGGFLPFQLILTYFAMAAISLAYLGLYAVNYRKGGATETIIEGKTGEWGFSESPLVFEDKVFVSVGGDKTTIVALNKNTGETIWQSKSLNDYSAYVSPILVKENGKNIIINVMANNVLGIDADNGEIIFNHNYANIQNERLAFCHNPHELCQSHPQR